MRAGQMKRSSWTEILASKISANERLEEEIENDENGPHEEQQSGPTEMASTNATQGADQMRGSGPEAGFLSGTVERTEGLVTGEISAERTGFIIEP